MVADIVTPEPDDEPEAQPELSRVTVVVAGVEVDVGLPDDVAVGAIADEVIELADAIPAVPSQPPDAELGRGIATWTLARLGGEAFDRDRTLADVNICDGEVLVLRDVATPVAPMLFDDVDADIAPPKRNWLHSAFMAGCFAVGVIASAAAAGLVARNGAAPGVATALALGVGGIIAACVVAHRATGAEASPWLAAVALPMIFAGSLHLVAQSSPATSAPISFALVGFASLVTLLVTRRGRAFHTALIELSMVAEAATVAMLLWAPSPRTIGAILATASIIVIYLAPRATILLSQLPVPPVPTAGEPLDDIETQGGTTVEGVNAIGKQVIPTEEGLIERVRPSNQYLTGIVAAATVGAMVGTYLAVDVSNGFFWQGTVFAITVAAVLCLRGRSHYDLVQSATLIGGGLLTGSALIAKTAASLDDWRVNAALGLVVLTALIVGCGLIAPRLKFSPVMRRQIEILEFIAIGMLFPLCAWIIRLYSFFRELRV